MHTLVQLASKNINPYQLALKFEQLLAIWTEVNIEQGAGAYLHQQEDHFDIQRYLKVISNASTVLSHIQTTLVLSEWLLDLSGSLI